MYRLKVAPCAPNCAPRSVFFSNLQRRLRSQVDIVVTVVVPPAWSNRGGRRQVRLVVIVPSGEIQERRDDCQQPDHDDADDGTHGDHELDEVHSSSMARRAAEHIPLQSAFWVTRARARGPVVGQ